MKRIAVIGGGISGLSAAVYLANSGLSVELFEAAPKLGGRAFSFIDENSGDTVDNGQHILMGCYKETLQFLKLINAFDNLYFQENLIVNFINKEKGVLPLKSFSKLYPFNLMLGILNYRALNIFERVKILKLFFKLIAVPTDSLDNITVIEWLKNENQSENALKSFWEILAIGSLNTNIEKASAKIFADILKHIFFRGNKSSTIILPETGLSELYCSKARDFISSHNGKVNISCKVASVEILRDKIVSLIINKKNITGFDYIISAVPFYSFQKLFNEDFLIQTEKLDFNYSPILNVHIWLKENPLTDRFYGLIGSPVQWIFNHNKYISIVISDAGSFIDITNDEILDLVTVEINSFFPKLKSELISGYKVIREKRATFIPEPSVLNNRPSVKTKIKNLFLAGDWTDTGLPATIESAVKSGKMAANSILNEV